MLTHSQVVFKVPALDSTPTLFKMSFFGFEEPRHNPAAPGFSQAHDPFAGLSHRDDEGDALEFEDTYDGLGDQLDETDDAFNDDTFGGGDGGASKPGPVGKDFDFFGQTAKVSNAIEEEHVRFNRQPPAAKAAAAAYNSISPNYIPQSYGKPARTGYEKYKEEPIEDLQVDAAIWGVTPKNAARKQQPQQSAAAGPAPIPAQPHAQAMPGRKMMSLEEVEAQMRAQAKRTPQPSAQPQAPAPPSQPQFHQQAPFDGAVQFAQPQLAQQQTAPHTEGARPKEPGQHHGHGHPVTILQRPQSKQSPHAVPSAPSPQQRQQPTQQAQPVHPTQILQNPNRLSGDAARLGHGHQPPHPDQATYPAHPTHSRQQGSFSQGHQPAHPALLAQLSEEQKAAYLEQEARRAKRNHKIFLMSRDNGVMTPQDKNFVTRIQLQQLVSATGNPNEHGTDDSLAEDFYYQVHNQIQGGQRQHPSQPLNNFAQTYLFQTGSRQGGLRRQHRGGENHMQRMEQQVQRAVEAAKNKPKNKQLIIEGSLGKISFSNAKTPKPLLHIKRTEATSESNRPGSSNKNAVSDGIDSKSVLRAIELVYSTLMKMEDHDRNTPPPPASEADTEAVQKFVAWRDEAQRLNHLLWEALKVHEPIGVYPVHPFIALLSYSKGKKAMQRVFRHTTQEQRTTILTLIVVHLDALDVVRGAQVNTNDTRLNAAMRENIDLFSLAVMSTLFNFMNELDLDIVAGILGLVCNQNVDVIAKSRVGASMLTMILSRAEIIKQNSGGNEHTWQAW